MGACAAALGSAALRATVAQLSSRAVAAEPQDTWIDAHSHIWSTDVAHFPLANKITLADLEPASFADDELMAIAAPEGVDRVVLIQHSVFHRFDNSYVLDAVRRHPRRFAAVGMIDHLGPKPGAEMKRLLALGTTGFRITPFVRDEKPDAWLASPGMIEMWQTAAGTGQAMCCLIDPQFLPGVDKMCGVHPDAPVVIDHCARIGGDGTIRAADVKQLCELARHKRVSVKLSAFYYLGEKQPPHLELVPMIRRLFDSFGPERLMWASDSPYQLQHGNDYHASISLVRDKLDFASAADRRHLLRTTAERVFFFA